MGQYEVKANLVKRVVSCRMHGVFTADEMREWAKLYHAETLKFGGKQHMVLADMRGMKTLRADAATVMGEAIGFARRHGVVLCAHISDDTVQRLQAARLGRQNSAHDDVTVDVDSLETADDVLNEGFSRINDTTKSSSVR